MKTARRWSIFGVVVAGVLGGHAPLRAQPADAPAPAPVSRAPAPADDAPTAADDAPWNEGVSLEERRAARELFLEGNRLFRVPLFARAAEQYAAALARWKHPAFYFNLALAQINLGRELEAHESLQHALRYGEAPLGAPQLREAQRQLQEIRRRIGQIRVTCETPGAEVALDGVTLFIGPGSYEGWVAAKAHELTAKKAGYLSEARRVTVAAGERQQIELRLITLIQATDRSRRWAAWKPWAVAAAGGAIAAAGGVMHVLSARSFDAYDARFAQLDCAAMLDPARPGCTEDEIGPARSALLERAERRQAMAIAGYVVGGSLLAAGVVLSYMNRPRATERAPEGRITVAPAVSADLVGVLVRVRH